jgi:hypothetical protein
VEYTQRNPFPVGFGLAGSLGGLYFAEQHAEETHSCKTLWIFMRLLPAMRFDDLPPTVLENPSLKTPLEVAAGRDLGEHEEQLDVIAGAKHSGIPVLALSLSVVSSSLPSVPGKTTAAKLFLTGRHGLFVDLHGIKEGEGMLDEAELKVLKAMSFRKHPKGVYRPPCSLAVFILFFSFTLMCGQAISNKRVLLLLPPPGGSPAFLGSPLG